MHKMALCNRDQLRTEYGITYGDTQLNRKMKGGSFPMPIGRNGPRAIRHWLRVLIEAWISGE